MKSTPEIRGVKARAIVVPLKRPLRNAFGVFEAAPLVLIDVATDQGVTGRSYIFAYATMTQKPLVHLIEQNSNGPKRRSQNILCNDLWTMPIQRSAKPHDYEGCRGSG